MFNYTVGEELLDFEMEDGVEKSEMVEDAFDRIGQQARTRAKQLVPVDTGALRASIDYRVQDGELFLYATEDYAAYVELGTYKQDAQPYIRPAIEEAINNFKG